jgi:hypothetical protein
MGCGTSSSNSNVELPPARPDQRTVETNKISEEETVVVEDLCVPFHSDDESTTTGGGNAANIERTALTEETPCDPQPSTTSTAAPLGPWKLPPPPAQRFVVATHRQIIPANRIASTINRRSSRTPTPSTGTRPGKGRMSVQSPGVPGGSHANGSSFDGAAVSHNHHQYVTVANPLTSDSRAASLSSSISVIAA